MVKPGISGKGIPFEGNDLILSIHSVRILPRPPAAASGILSPLWIISGGRLALWTWDGVG